MTPAHLNKLRQRVDALTGKPVPPELAAKESAMIALHHAGVRLAGDDRAAWFARCATGRATPADLAMLAELPADALRIAGAVDALEYAKLMHRVFSDF